MGSLSSDGAALYYSGGEDHLHEPHFLQSCSRCNKRLGFNSDIFMYRGDTPFCSKECRQEQIEMDEAKEKRKWGRSGGSKKKMKTPSMSSSSSSPPSSSTRSSRKSDTVVVS
ncbi:hypothetical protein SAY87_021130 [Trapa incisa]|uniref:FLZ-type domain-containing protein n=1 Tax=Trapa incisa TaxID=236973 RepID=A0AAN7JSS0_9MYRT|nr:hypothetical protein SAY87_021130 [Trapa incisa]